MTTQPFADRYATDNTFRARVDEHRKHAKRRKDSQKRKAALVLMNAKHPDVKTRPY